MSAFMDVFDRRAVLKGHDNTGGRADYLAGLQGRLVFAAPKIEAIVTVRYVPDRYVVTPESFNTYLKTVERLDWDGLEDVALAIVKDIANEMLTRWTQVNLKSAHPELTHVAAHDVTVEDRQPGWHNDDLLYRMAPI